jgi:hypothetical protein
LKIMKIITCHLELFELLHFFLRLHGRQTSRHARVAQW